MRNLVVWVGLAVALLTVNFLIVKKMTVVQSGDVVLLEIAPRDPRSIMQGDFMTLNYRLTREISGLTGLQQSGDGLAVVKLDAQRVARLLRLYRDGESLSSDERLVRYRIRFGHVKVVTDAYYFQEGHGAYYAQARYGLFRVGANGDTVLIGLCDAEFKRLSAVDAPRETCADAATGAP